MRPQPVTANVGASCGSGQCDKPQWSWLTPCCHHASSDTLKARLQCLCPYQLAEPDRPCAVSTRLWKLHAR